MEGFITASKSSWSRVKENWTCYKYNTKVAKQKSVRNQRAPWHCFLAMIPMKSGAFSADATISSCLMRSSVIWDLYLFFMKANLQTHTNMNSQTKLNPMPIWLNSAYFSLTTSPDQKTLPLSASSLVLAVSAKKSQSPRTTSDALADLKWESTKYAGQTFLYCAICAHIKKKLLRIHLISC